MKIIILMSLIFLLDAEPVMSRVKVYYHDFAELEMILQTPEISVLKQKAGGYFDAVVEAGNIRKLDELGLDYVITLPDIAEHYENLRAGAKGGVFGNYYLYSEVLQEITQLQSQYPGLVKVDSLTIRSIEDRALYTVKISNSPGANNDRPEVLFSGAIHAYEPIGVSVCITDMNYLCENYTVDPDIKWLVDNRQVYFIPVMNPDGYVFNETYPSMMWRKNRRYNAGGSYGVDLNRNYPYKWGYDNVGSSPNETAWNYRGTEPASEPETQAVMDFVNAHQFRLWHNHHAPGDVLLIPFSYINSYPWSDTLEYYTVCREESLLYGFLDWGNSTQAYGYPCNGELGDWAWCDSAAYKILGFVPELGPDYWGGLNDSSEIVSICQSMLKAELYLMEVAGFYPLFSACTVIDTFPNANNDGILNPGERADLQIVLQNKAVVDTAFELSGILNTLHAQINIVDSNGYYGDVIRLAQAINAADPFNIACSASAIPYDWIYFSLDLVWDSGSYEKTLVCSLQIGPQTSIKEYARESWEPSFIGPTIITGAEPFLGSPDYKLFDITGRAVDTGHLIPGVYFIGMDNRIIGKVVKVR